MIGQVIDMQLIQELDAAIASADQEFRLLRNVRQELVAARVQLQELADLAQRLQDKVKQLQKQNPVTEVEMKKATLAAAGATKPVVKKKSPMLKEALAASIPDAAPPVATGERMLAIRDRAAKVMKRGRDPFVLDPGPTDDDEAT